MADSFIAIDEPAVVDKKLDTEQLTVGANTVERERFLIAGQGATDLVKPVAHDAVDAGNPLPIGGYASTATPTAVSADADRVRAWFTLNGALNIADAGGSLTVDGSVGVSNLPTTVDTNSGAKSASTLRVVLATDQPALTNKLLVTPDSVALPANQSVNAAQLAGTTTDTNSGNKSAGTLRVVIATDQPALTNKLLVTPDSVALPANQSVNVAQINGVTPLMGAGNTGTGSLRVTISTDQTQLTNALKVDGSAVTQPVSIATNQPVGTVAHDGADSGNPLKVGAKAITSLATATLVASADRTDAQSDLDGAIITRAQFTLGDLKSESVTNTNGTSTASGVFTAVASTKNYITGITVYRTDAGATPAFVDFRDGTAGAILWSMPLPPNGGSILPTGAVPWFKTSANTALAFDVSAALTTVTINISGFQSKL